MVHFNILKIYKYNKDFNIYVIGKFKTNQTSIFVYIIYK